jgi:hypothetical protein
MQTCCLTHLCFHCCCACYCFSLHSTLRAQLATLDALSNCCALSTLYSTARLGTGPLRTPVQQLATQLAGTLQFAGLRAARPLPGLTVAAPPASILHPSIALSVLGQFFIQEGTTAWIKALARHCDASQSLVTVVGVAQSSASSSLKKGLFAGLQPEYQPTVTKSVVFIMALVQSVAVVLTNYKGVPYMTPLAEVGTQLAGGVIAELCIVLQSNAEHQLVAHARSTVVQRRVICSSSERLHSH